MIRNWDEQRLGMSFENISVVCSDIDMVHITNGGKLIIGEIKNEKGNFGVGQRHLLTSIVDAYQFGGAVLFIVHDKDVHTGDTVVDVAECQVKEYYTGGKWIVPARKTKVKEIMERMEERSMGATIEGKAKVWVKDHEWGKTYTISIASKDKDGNWVNVRQPLRFKKDMKILPENGAEINFKGFATTGGGKENPYVLWQITEFTFVGNEVAQPSEPSFSQLTENDIPF